MGRSAAGAALLLVGVYLSFFLDSAPAPTIVLVFALVFVLSLPRYLGRSVPGLEPAKR